MDMKRDFLAEYSGECLYHHGIMGQKWGVRRFQNKDGSLTEAGRKRYLKNSEDARKALRQFKQVNDQWDKASKEYTDMYDKMKKASGNNKEEIKQNILDKLSKACDDKYTRKDLEYDFDVDGRELDTLYVNLYYPGLTDKRDAYMKKFHDEVDSLYKKNKADKYYKKVLPKSVSAWDIYDELSMSEYGMKYWEELL